MKPTIPNRQPQLWQNPDTGKAHIRGLSVCGSVWVCPVCSAKINSERRKELKLALDLADRLGWRVLFVTLTASHTRDDKLPDLFKSFKSAKRSMRSGRKWQDVKSDYLVKGGVTATEITWGFANGWHVHFHEIMFVGGAVNQEEVEERFYNLWSNALSKQGLSCSRERGVKVLLGTDKAGDYITKWGLDLELATTDKKGKDGHFTPFQLLDLYGQGEAWAGGLFQDYADVTKGKVSLRWSRKLRDKLGLEAELTDLELAQMEEDQNAELLVRFTRSEYNKLLRSGRDDVIPELLSVAEAGREAVLQWLDENFDIHPEVPP